MNDEVLEVRVIDDSAPIYVRDPVLRGRYIRTQFCVKVVACPLETCGADVGVPCASARANCEHIGPSKYRSSTHYARRDAYQRWKRAKA